MATTVDMDITNGDAIPVVPLWIGGEETTSTPPVTFPFYSSAQRKTVSLVHAADVPAAIRACDAADIAFHTWGNSRPADRREIMLRAVDILEARRPEMVALQVAETSCPEGWAHFNLDNLIGIMRESASRITTVCAGTLPSLAGEGTLALVFKRPVGPVLLIAP
jgi:acyl-CoA reductase-like NAD-dependent aldehyde dehydrogenase